MGFFLISFSCFLVSRLLFQSFFQSVYIKKRLYVLYCLNNLLCLWLFQLCRFFFLHMSIQSVRHFRLDRFETILQILCILCSLSPFYLCKYLPFMRFSIGAQCLNVVVFLVVVLDDCVDLFVVSCHSYLSRLHVP